MAKPSSGVVAVRRALGAALVLVAAGCAPAEPRAGASVSVEALGEPTDGFPSWGERVVFVWTNRARADPAADLASCGATCAERACYSPVPPVVWSHDLSRAARFHSANLVLGGCGLQHNSPCTVLSSIGTLYTPGSCDGAPSCACMGGSAACGSAGTAFGTRVGYFGTPASAENIARGRTDPVATFYQWLHEADSNPACGWRTANGHRANILGSSRSLGVGLASTTWTQDFGGSGTPAGIVGGVHYPRTGAALDFRANWYAAAAPRSAQVSVEGVCHPMSIERGSSTNGTYLANVTAIPSSCTRYVFHFVDSAGADILYPSTGSFAIGCAAEWDATRPATCGACVPSCGARVCGDDGCGGSCGTCGTGRTCGASGTCACAAGRTDCGGTCVNTATDEAHCGGCGRPCGAGSTCTASVCTPPSLPDAGPSASDAGPSAADAGGTDAGASAADAGPSAADAGTSTSDAGAAAEDAGPPPADAGPSVGDAGPRADAGSGAADGGEGPGTALVGTCTCRTLRARPSPGAAVVLGGLAVAMAARRRRAVLCRGGDGARPASPPPTRRAPAARQPQEVRDDRGPGTIRRCARSPSPGPQT